MDLLCQFRDDVRRLADQGKGPLLELSDKLRDEKLPDLGIELTDGDKGQKATWNFSSKEEILKKQAQKANQATGKASKTNEAQEKKLTPPEKIFMGKWNDKDFTKYDEKGVPTHWIKEEKSKKSPDFGKKIEKEINE